MYFYMLSDDGRMNDRNMSYTNNNNNNNNNNSNNTTNNKLT
jgi:hypothetical protein